MASEYPGKQISRGQIEFVLVHDGVDGNGIEFVYLRTNTATAPSVVVKPDSYVDSNGHTYLDDDFLPKVSVGGQEYECTDSPVGVDGTHQYEWIAQRVKGAADSDGRRAWLKYEGAMTLWSKWGERGTDGDGVEYVFTRTADESTVPTILNNNDYTEGSIVHHYTDDDFCPMTSVGRATDDPQGVSAEYLCEWVAMRTKGAPNAQGVREWLPFAVNSEMRLWAKYGLDNDSIVLAPSLLALADDGSAQDWYTNYYTEIQVKKADKILRPLYVDHIKVFNDEDTLIYEATAEEVEIGTSGVYTVEITPVFSDANYPIMFQYVRAVSTTDPYGQPRIREGNFLKVTRCTSLAANSGYFRVEVNINHDTSPYETGIIWTNPSPVAGSSSLSYTISHATDTMYGTQATDAVPLTVGSTTKNIFTQGSKTANTVLAAPNGSAGEASFRALVEADIPTLSTSKISGLGTAATRGVATSIGPSITNLVPGSLLYSVLGDSFDSSNTVKSFINSSIATATADYKNNYNVVSDLGLAYNAAHSAIEAALGQTISGADNNDYCFVEIPTSSTDPTQLARIERYKFNGTSWAYEYVLNNSSFTAAQWASINSGITASKVSLISGLNTRVGDLESRVNWDDYFGIDQQTGAIYVKMIDQNTPRGFYSFGFITAGGVGSGSGGGGGVDIARVWQSLTNNPADPGYENTKIAVAHIPDLAMSKITGLSTALAGKADASALSAYALTSSLGSMAYASTGDYLPKSGGTMSGSLSIVTSGESSITLGSATSGISGAIYLFAGGSRYTKLVTAATGASHTITFPNSDGTVALTSDLSNYLPLAGGTMSNTNVVTNLNSDLLDGKNADWFISYNALTLGNDVDCNTIPYNRYTCMVVQPIHKPNYSGQTNYPFDGFGQMVTYSGQSSYFPFRIAVAYQSAKLFVQTAEYGTGAQYNFIGGSSWREVAFIDSKVASAGNADTVGGYQESRFFRKNLIWESADCNSMEDNSFTILDRDAGGLTCANKPSDANITGGYGVLTIRHGAYRNQLFFPYGGCDVFTRSSVYVGGVVWMDWQKLYHSGNSNLTTVPWNASSLTLNGGISGVTNITGSGYTLTFDSNFYGVILSGSYPHIAVQNTDNDDNAGISFIDRAGTEQWALSYRGLNNANKDLAIYNSYLSTFAIWFKRSNNYVGFGTTNPQYNVDVAGVIHATTGIFSDGYVTAGTASDIRLKENVNTLDREDAKRIVMGLRPVTFSWNSLAHGLCEKYEGDDIGFIAQEVQPLVPQAIGSIFSDYLRMDSTKFIAPLVSIAQSHESRLEAAEREIIELKRENAELRARINN